MNRPFARLLMILVAVVAAPVAVADSPVSVLDRFLDEVETLSGRFEQRQYDDRGELVASSGGTVEIARPDRFHWSYQTPYAQQVVCDGDTIWIHDPDLEQVTRRPAGVSLAGTPAALLSRDRAALAAFHVEVLARDGDLTPVRLLPLDAESDFRRIQIHFDGVRPVQVQFVDQLGGTTRIDLIDTVVNRPIEPARFQFQPPAGTEIVDG